MKFGATGALNGETYALAKKLGYDYFETAFRSVATLSDEEYAEWLKISKEVGLPVLRANGLFYNEQHFFGDDAMTEDEIKAFLDKGFARAKELGIGTVVWGSGPTRKYPDTMTREEAMKTIFKYGNIIADFSKKYDIPIAIEPLCQAETNIFNTVQEACEYIRELNRPEIKVLADSFHMMAESEKFSTLGNNADLLIHTHIASAIFGSTELRKVPDLKDEHNTKDFIAELKKIGYNDTVSIEAGLRSGDWEKDMTEALEALRSWDK